MEATINEIRRSPTGYAEVVFVVSARKLESYKKPDRENFVQPWMEKTATLEAAVALKEAEARYEEQLAAWEGNEAAVTSHNNTLEALRLGTILMAQETFVPTEVRK